MDLDEPPIQYNRDFSEAIYPYVEILSYVHFALSIILTLVMFKKPNVSKSFLYVDLLLDLPKRCLP